MKHVCKECSAVFSSLFQLCEHENTHSNEQPFLCPNCKLTFSLISKYVEHALTQCKSVFLNEERNSNRKTDIIFDSKAIESSTVLAVDITPVTVDCQESANVHQNINSFNYSNVSNYEIVSCNDTYASKKDKIIVQDQELVNCENINCIDIVAPLQHKKTPRKKKLEEGLECSMCQKKFTTTKLLREHIRRFPGPHNFRCNWCSKSFKTLERRKTHLCLAATETEDFKCSCLQSFVSTAEFRNHLGSKPYSCCNCQMLFNNVTNLIRHIRTHTQQKPYKCRDCDRSFAQAATLRNHVTVHLGTNAMKCNLCSFSCKTQGGLFKHQKKHKEGKETGDLRKISSTVYECSKCEKQFKFARNLAMHMKIHASGEVLCPTCGRLFLNSRRLAVHIRAAHGESCMCSGCGKVFASASLLNSHAKIHVTEKQFSCCICFKSFATRGYLFQHSKTHRAIKPYACSYCGKNFKVAASLKYHHKVSCIKVDI